MSTTEERRRDIGSPIDKKIGWIIQHRRLDLGLTLDQVGTAIDRDHSTIKQYESASRSVPKHNVIPLSEILGMEPHYFDRATA